MQTRKAPTYLNMTAFTNRYNAPASTVYGYLRRGGLKGKKVGGRWQIDITPTGGLPKYFTSRQATGLGFSKQHTQYQAKVKEQTAKTGTLPWWEQPALRGRNAYKPILKSPISYKTRLAAARMSFATKFAIPKLPGRGKAGSTTPPAWTPPGTIVLR